MFLRSLNEQCEQRAPANPRSGFMWHSASVLPWLGVPAQCQPWAMPGFSLGSDGRFEDVLECSEKAHFTGLHSVSPEPSVGW